MPAMDLDKVIVILERANLMLDKLSAMGVKFTGVLDIPILLKAAGLL